MAFETSQSTSLRLGLNYKIRSKLRYPPGAIHRSSKKDRQNSNARSLRNPCCSWRHRDRSEPSDNKHSPYLASGVLSEPFLEFRICFWPSMDLRGITPPFSRGCSSREQRLARRSSFFREVVRIHFLDIVTSDRRHPHIVINHQLRQRLPVNQDHLCVNA